MGSAGFPAFFVSFYIDGSYPSRILKNKHTLNTGNFNFIIFFYSRYIRVHMVPGYDVNFCICINKRLFKKLKLKPRAERKVNLGKIDNIK